MSKLQKQLNQMLSNFTKLDNEATEQMNMLAGAFGGSAPIERKIEFLDTRLQQALALIGKIAEIALEEPKQIPKRKAKIKK